LQYSRPRDFIIRRNVFLFRYSPRRTNSVAIRGRLGMPLVPSVRRAAYPIALNATTGNWERGGAYEDRVAAMQWAEWIAGLHPGKPGDVRPGFPFGAALKGGAMTEHNLTERG